MARPPGNADRLMIEAAMELARKNGCSSLRIREVARRAGVNLGMFHYHFKNRKAFTRILLGAVYGEFFDELTRVSAGSSDPLKRLRESLVLAGGFLRKNRRIVVALFKDILNEEPEVLRYAQKNTPPHVFVLLELFEKCRSEGLLPDISIQEAFPLFFGAVAQPVIFGALMEKSKRRLKWFDFEEIMSDRAIARRVDIVLRGLGARGL